MLSHVWPGLGVRAALEMGRTSVISLKREVRKLRGLDSSYSHHWSTAKSGPNSGLSIGRALHLLFPLSHFILLQEFFAAPAYPQSRKDLSMAHTDLLSRVNYPVSDLWLQTEAFLRALIGKAVSLKSMVELLGLMWQFTGLPLWWFYLINSSHQWNNFISSHHHFNLFKQMPACLTQLTQMKEEFVEQPAKLGVGCVVVSHTIYYYWRRAAQLPELSNMYVVFLKETASRNRFRAEI